MCWVSDQGERVIRIYDLKYAEARVLMSIMKQAVPESMASATGQRIIVFASQSEHRRVMELIREIDVRSPPEQKSLKVFRLLNTQADSMLATIANIVVSKDVALAVDDRTNSLLAVGPEDKLKVIEAVLMRLDQTSDRDLLQPKKTYRVRIAWFAEGPPSDKAVKVTEDLQPVFAELSRIGIEGLCQVGQTIVSATPQGRFQVGCSAVFGDGPADLEIRGNLDMEEETPHLRIEISARRDQALEGPNTGKTKRVQLVNLATEIVAPLNHCVVLGVTPMQEKTLAFVVQVRSGD